MPSSKTLLRLAEQADRDADKLEAEAVKAREQARELRRLAESAPTSNTLTDALTPVKVNVNKVTDEHRINIAKGQTGGRDKRFVDTLADKNYTQRKLADELKITPALLSMYRRKDEPRPIPQARAERIEELTGWKAVAKNWPGGIVS